MLAQAVGHPVTRRDIEFEPPGLPTQGLLMRAGIPAGRAPIRFVEVGLSETLKWSAKHRMYAYDAYLLECARQFRSALLTLDAALINVAKSEGFNVLEV